MDYRARCLRAGRKREKVGPFTHLPLTCHCTPLGLWPDLLPMAFSFFCWSVMWETEALLALMAWAILVLKTQDIPSLM